MRAVERVGMGVGVPDIQQPKLGEWGSIYPSTVSVRARVFSPRHRLTVD